MPVNKGNHHVACPSWCLSHFRLLSWNCPDAALYKDEALRAKFRRKEPHRKAKIRYKYILITVSEQTCS